MREPHLCADCAVVFDEERGFHVFQAITGYGAYETIRVVRPDKLRVAAEHQGKIVDWWCQAIRTRRGPSARFVDVPAWLDAKADALAAAWEREHA